VQSLGEINGTFETCTARQNKFFQGLKLTMYGASNKLNAAEKIKLYICTINMTSSQLLFVTFPPNNLPQSTNDKMYFFINKKCRRNWIRFNKLVDRGSEMEIAVIHAS
jgi:hypothetical protein